ncbi:hypothetical protein AGENTSMITH_142 [Bacillus phage vB_BspM_AgentSmith]|nr:hypothetical protein AGENTSMITH_142 [Bacillus phage vB_BspM_AgentSmith]
MKDKHVILTGGVRKGEFTVVSASTPRKVAIVGGELSIPLGDYTVENKPIFNTAFRTHTVNTLLYDSIYSLLLSSRDKEIAIELTHPDRVVDLTLHPNGDLTQTDSDVMRGYIEDNLISVTNPKTNKVTLTVKVSNHKLNIRRYDNKQIIGSVKLGLNIRSEPTIFIKYKV